MIICFDKITKEIISIHVGNNPIPPYDPSVDSLSIDGNKIDKLIFKKGDYVYVDKEKQIAYIGNNEIKLEKKSKFTVITLNNYTEPVTLEEI